MNDDQLNPETSERFLIGTLGTAPGRVERELDTLPSSAFYDPHLGAVWRAAAALQQADTHIEPTTIARQLAKTNEWNAGTQAVLSNVMLANHGIGQPSYHAGLVQEYAERRELLKFAVRAQQIALADNDNTASERLAAIQSEMEKLDRNHDSGDDGPKPWSRLIAEWDIAMDPYVVRPDVYPTPWDSFNEAIQGGLHPGRFYVWAGRPGDGKSTAAFNIARYLGERSTPVLFVSAEMSDLDVASRVVANGAGIDLGEIARHEISQWNHRQLDDWRAKTPDLSLWVESRPTTLPQIKAVARRFKRRHNLAVLMVDYLQLVRTGEKWGNREQEVAHISRELKALALELGIAVVAPTQLNRSPAGRSDGRPILSDLRDSGQIEQDADVVVLLHHPATEVTDPHTNKVIKERTGEVTFILGKNRHGPTMDIPLDWNGGYATIASYRPRSEYAS